MGAFLDKPKTEKVTQHGCGNGIRYGVSAMQGWRMEMEDAHVCQLGLPKVNEKFSFFGVFDGHAGPRVAKESSEFLLDHIVGCIRDDNKDLSQDTDIDENAIGDAISKGFINFDDSLQKKNPWKDGQDRSGTTAIVTMITPEKIIWGNCGDSRGLLCRDGKLEFATTDHKPVNETERLRIEKAGGTVMMQRVNGSLAVSRALGDFDYKRVTELKPTEQLVSPEPEITKLDRDLSKDQFLLLACDGVFDVMTNEEVIAFVLRRLRLKDELSDVCSELIDHCLHKVRKK